MPLSSEDVRVGRPPVVGGYRTRVLPTVEWERLRPFPFATNGLPDPELTTIVVSENGAGEIVGIWAALTAVHLDGLWVHPDHHDTIIAGQLLRTMKDTLQAYGISVSFTVIQDPAVMVLAYKAGMIRAPGDLWMLQLPPREPVI